MNSISVVGLGKLGSCLAASLAASNVGSILGIDINPAVVNSINRKKAHIYEPGLEDLLQSNSNLEATTNIERAITETDITIILVPTPSLKDGSFSLEYVLQVCEALGKHLAGRSEYHLIVISSTVMPGSCDNRIKKCLESSSGRTIGRDLGLCYCPEFVALGNALAGFQKPDFVMIGQSDDKAGQKLQAIYEKFCLNNPPIIRMNLVNAEIAKIALNFYITCKISIANTLAEICENVKGANIDDVTGAIGLDSRIGTKYLKGATAYAGACFPRDVRAIRVLAQLVCANDTLPQSIGLVNKWQVNRLKAKVQAEMTKKDTLGIIGLAFKPNTDVTEESTGMSLYEMAKYERYDVIVYDPVVVCDDSLDDLQSCVDQSDVLVVTNPYDLDIDFHAEQTVIDCWRVLDKEKAIEQGAKYIAIGVGK